ncbi:MAG: hypothetical protein D6687_03185 [Acidobacteria bacterium]|jgi:type I restriction-modification system DNA methylase subunit|nr:MAG: hypothetical protein D6687_03185 [Acidobacteriota bacterium]GIU83210.1 MAG: hypothetical protein KatS3mg006_2274 [Pyrinomonadaceae bacterium]
MIKVETVRRELEEIGEIKGFADLRAKLEHLFLETLRWGNPQGMREFQLSAPVSQKISAVPVAQASGLPVYLVEWPDEKLPGTTARRAVQRALAPVSTEHIACYVTKDYRQLAFTWAHRRTDGRIELRTLPYEVGSPARTTVERLAELAFTLDELSSDKFDVNFVIKRLENAFSVEAVTEKFFCDYKNVFDELQKRLFDATQDRTWAHDYALQLLNRLMFLYFVQRKRWLGKNSRFLRHFWESYKRSGQLADSFFERWLDVLFFEAFNKKFHGGYTYFPDDIKDALQMAPYLNGGLFRRNQLDEKHCVKLTDDFFSILFDEFDSSTPGFLERYNFTITESTPLDVEVAVDPEMIGKVYESLVNVTSEGLAERDRRGAAGIFYTPRVEIDLMCRLALVDALTNRLGEEHKPILYDAVFAVDAAEKEQADQAIVDKNLWPDLNDALRKITVCDPACGSGSFLVGMLLVLDDLQARANKILGIEETPYERRRRIIGEQLYGIDVMDWAVHIAELRLWLQLVVETEIHHGELILRPLLPNLSFKVRCGDSLVQEVAGINFGLHRQHLDIPPALKGKLTQLKGEKQRFYQGKEEVKEADLRQKEVSLFREILQHRIHQKQNELAGLEARLNQPKVQLTFADMDEKPSSDRKRELEDQIAMVQAEIDRYREALEALKTVQDIPFVWDIAFVEIFEGESEGFDIVIGNPPYVRQEKIAPPNLSEENYSPEEWRKQKALYKEKLQRSAAMAWPRFFHLSLSSNKYRKLDGKSDLYIYFYFHGLSLLNPKGSFCFITSNSWLDVGYGADLQEFLLRHSHIKLILDNEKKRSFAQADVNTVIALLSPADDKNENGLENLARFVMFKKPFEEVVSANTFKEIEKVNDRLVTESYRVNARYQKDLLDEGMIDEDDDEESVPREVPNKRRSKSSNLLIKTARYKAGKWGGKYLRAPEIFFTILEKGKGKLVRLGDIAEVRRGFTTGANEFFYLEPTGQPAPAGYLHVRNGAGWEGLLEEKFLKPVIKSPREVRTIVIRPEDLRYKIFMCHEEKTALKGTAALEYIQWGEKQGYHLRPSCASRKWWWDLGIQGAPPIVLNKGVNDRHFVALNSCGAFCDQQIYELTLPPVSAQLIAACLNWTGTAIFWEQYGRRNFGEGVLWIAVYEASSVLTLLHTALYKVQQANLLSAFHRLSQRPIRSIFEELGFPLYRKRRCGHPEHPYEHMRPEDLTLEQVRQASPDRFELDAVVFDVLGLTNEEREAVYKAVVELVRARLEKARSI